MGCLLIPCILWDLKHYCDLAPMVRLGVSRYYYCFLLTEEMIVELLDVEATIM
jgi:hypothetical protein